MSAQMNFSTYQSLAARYRPIRTGLLLLAVLAGASAAAADDGLVGNRPHAGGAADEVSVRFVLLDIDKVDDVAQRFDIDAYFEISWRDPRLAVPGEVPEEQSIRTLGFDDIWNPGLTVVNNRGLTFLLPEIASVDPDGVVTIRQRISGELSADLDLHRFPFDTQRLALNIVSYRYQPTQLVFAEDSTFVANTDSFSADGWQFSPLESEHSVFRLRQGAPGAPQLTFAVRADRNSGFFVLTLALPMVLILSMAWMVHWLQPDIVPARIGMSTATVFSLIALGVSFRLSLPRIDYLTRADIFVLYSTLLVLLSLGVTVLATRWDNAGRQDAAIGLTLAMRWAFPLIFAAIAALTLRP